MLRPFGAVRQLLRRQRLRAADPHGHGEVGHGSHENKSWFSPGDNDPGGYLFNETPPPPGHSRKWEDWELPYYATGVIAFLMLSIGLSSKPDTNIDTWARNVALKRLEEEEQAAAAAKGEAP
ncbi:hypothetical protein KP509_37G058100 [Ceratopteris richardii]|uniref:Complex I-ESSS n=1 Tax=Ceratopteris richardii TaxID=49495 RepID=A0A8T2QAK2_CERRI|nr:hypothetical protein KP509_37G058100 [Ceratopteris richardii]